ncbi:Glutathione S-transferase 2 [Recurvomyces mirabilis]|uniref:Glutathione S-transferase 2 n=1 Tax=Recurvomyces mirabilis TaxID=574656 RepID=A0AAE0WGE0_9PEZI|nr:Glutathione S-transferase 2 [Recurvomyces mirabilis]KAK5150569.1 Glutathione S-transferase 2 [Recurvomyces mirabilis]
MSGSDVHLYTTQTPNGVKISIALEELGLPYEFTKIDISKNTQKACTIPMLACKWYQDLSTDSTSQEQWFLDINPNGRIPALTDKFTDGKTIRLFESGSIMQYLVDRYDKDHKISFPPGSPRYAPEHIEYGVNRYQNETRRLYGVLDKHLADAKTDYIVGNKCTIADIAHWGWISAGPWAGVEVEHYPHLKAWEDRMWGRPAVQKGANVPDPYKMKELLADKEKMEKHAAQSRAWVQQGMKDDAEKNKARTQK